MFWPKGPDLDAFYIIKQKRGNRALTPINAVHDHLSNSIYQLFGVCTPDLYIGVYQEQLSLISEVIPGYRDLIDWFDAFALETINSKPDVAQCITAYQVFESSLSIIGKESLLAAAIILDDTDVIGADLRNLGLIKTGEQHQIIKIDPSDALFDTLPENREDLLREFEGSISLDNPCIHGIFVDDFVSNNPGSILGNLHLMEFFHDINVEKLKQELAKFANLSNVSIEHFVMRQEYLELLNSDRKHQHLENLVHILIGKRNLLKKLLNPVEIEFIPPALPAVRTHLSFSEPLERMDHGASRPIKVKSVEPLHSEVADLVL